MKRQPDASGPQPPQRLSHAQVSVIASSAQICVAHLLRKSNELSALRAFIDSYRACDAGMTHDLVVIFKGFRPDEPLEPYDECLAGIRHQRMFVPDRGFDVRPYLQVARAYPHAYFAFLNSFSRILAPGWLERLYRHASKPGVGLVGATGSHQSVASDNVQMRWVFPASMPRYRRQVRGMLRHARYLVTISGRFPFFPNYHIRTNAFMAAREVMTGLRTGPLLTKWGAYKLESGTHSMTRQAMNAGLTPLVVGADGLGYRPPEWPDARTFWIRDEENLLISDNQTRTYLDGTPQLRQWLAYHAWRRHPDGSPRADIPPAP